MLTITIWVTWYVIRQSATDLPYRPPASPPVGGSSWPIPNYMARCSYGAAPFGYSNANGR